MRRIDNGRVVSTPIRPYANREEAKEAAAGMNYPEIITRGYGYQYIVVSEEVKTAVDMRMDYQQMRLV